MPMRPGVTLREATLADAAELVALWSECASGQPLRGHRGGGLLQPLARAVAGGGGGGAGDDPGRDGRHMIVAIVDDELVGVLCSRSARSRPLNLTRTLTVHELLVSPRYRARSVAMTLLSAAEHAGEEHACEVVIAVTPAHAREPNRYLTKLGFAQVATVRAIQTSVLQSRLSTRTGASRDTGRLIAMRRTLRRREREAHRFAE